MDPTQSSPSAEQSIVEQCRTFLRQKVLTRKNFRVATITFAILLVPYLLMLGLQYRQLRSAFINRNEFVPTRIYSDVSRISPPLARDTVLSRLKVLGYETVPSGNTVSFKLRDMDYPKDLIPTDHPTFKLAGALTHLQFDGSGHDAVLVSIESGGQEIPEIYLEPELVTTLSRKNATQNDQIRDFVPFEKIPSAVWKAIMAVEDQHFLDHAGLDPRGFARAIWINLKTLSLAQGGSTLTQQLVKNLMVRRTKNVFLKFNELFLALFLEAEFSKERILERYLNELYLGQIGSLEIHGVAEGAEYFFGKKLEQLNMAEIALMAGLIRGPGYYSPYRNWERAIARQRLVLDKMVETDQIAPEEAVQAKTMPVRLVPPPKSTNKAPYFADYAKAQLIDKLAGRLAEQEIINAGFRVYTTLDPEMNDAGQAAVAAGVVRVRTQHKIPETIPLEGALAAVDQGNGYIRALVGGSSYQASSFNRILNMKRQVGSTFKPMVYLTALLQKKDAAGVPYGPAYPIEDAPWKLVYDGGKQEWAPENYEEEFRGWIGMREALAHSVNVAAAKLGVAVGFKNIIETARMLGVTSDLPAVPSLALGVAELSPVELLHAYSTLAARGVREELTVIRAITQNDGTPYAEFLRRPQNVLDEGAADLLTDLLREVFTTGTARFAEAMGFDRPAAGKTGTTSDHRDAWFAGFTPQLTTVVWVGLDRDLSAPAPAEGTPTEGGQTEPAPREPVAKLTGAGAALPIWVEFMRKALRGVPPAPFPVSPHLEDARIDRHSGFPATSGCPDPQVAVEKYLNQDSFGGRLGDEACQEQWPAAQPETTL